MSFTDVYTREDLIISLNIFSYFFFGFFRHFKTLSGQKMSGITVSYGVGPNGEKTEPSQGKEGEGWLVKPPQIKHWHLNEPYAEDDRGLLAEHPMNLGVIHQVNYHLIEEYPAFPF